MEKQGKAFDRLTRSNHLKTTKTRVGETVHLGSTGVNYENIESCLEAGTHAVKGCRNSRA